MRTTKMLRSAALTAVLVLVVAACGDDDTGTVATVDCTPGQVDGNLNFYNWSEYMDPDLITAFEAEYGVDVVESFYESNEAMLSQIQAGVAYDLVVPSDYMIKIMIDEGIGLPTRQGSLDQLREPGRGVSHPALRPYR